MTDISTFRKSHGNWWAFLIMGGLLIIFGILLLKYPLASISAFAMLFAVGFFISGIFEVIFSISNKNHLSSWGWYLVGGIIDLFLGMILLVNPVLSAQILVIFLGLWLLFRGIKAVGIAIETRHVSSDWMFLLVLGILEIIISFVVIIFPPVGWATLVIWASLTAVFLGIINLYIGFRVKNFYKNL